MISSCVFFMDSITVSGESFQEIQEPEQKTEKPETADAQGMSNDMILKLYEQGLSKVEIAKQLGRGLGEVNLVIELYKGDENL